MREIIAVCRSEKKSRGRVAQVLDRYFWRIGDRTWRGKATNACLDRVARELRRKATRNTAVVLHEIRSSSESRRPLIQIGSRSAFSEEGVVPVASHPASFRGSDTFGAAGQSSAGALAIAVLFHDLGKATNLFQAKLRRALNGGEPEADAVRHELFSTAVWDYLFGNTDDADLTEALSHLTPSEIDRACRQVRKDLKRIQSNPEKPLGFRFEKKEGSLSYLIGMLILTHHRLPSGDVDHFTLKGERHVRNDSPLERDTDLAIAEGTPFWHEEWWLRSLRKEAKRLRPESTPCSGDIALRASLMFADHLGSAKKKPNDFLVDHLANTVQMEGEQKPKPADSLSRHIKRVYRYCYYSHELTHAYRDRFPALDPSAVPTDIASPEPSLIPQFSWQCEAAQAARALCKSREGGFFAAILAGTGTGKTRAAPTILANAALADFIPERRYFRMSLGLGLRVLATQSAREYVDDLRFLGDDVAVLVGNPPLQFQEEVSVEGSESLVTLPEWLRVELGGDVIPEQGSPGEENWLRALSLDTGRGLPAFLDQVLEHAGPRARGGRRFLQAPIMVGTIDHLMGVAAPVNSRFLLQALRLLTSDLILDEIDQYEGEDLAAIGRLIFQAGAAGRRVVIMSATLTPDIAEAFHAAYTRGWSEHARATGVSDHVNLLLCGGTPESVFTNHGGESLSELLSSCRASIVMGLQSAPTMRRGEILPPCHEWGDLVSQVDRSCHRQHDLNAVEIGGLKVSVGMVRMTRIAHTAALAVQIRSGHLHDRLRFIVCLHSQMPRLHRAYIEARLKSALTRKGGEPEAGLCSLCRDHKVFERAKAAGVQEVEIVVVTSPVIETGNDLDFDYAILDPISTRSIIQAAGRVRRHRSQEVSHPNVMILGRSPIAMQGGTLSMPGVETRPAGDTGVARVEALKDFDQRLFADLAGEADFTQVDARPILSDRISFPLRDAEAHLRKQMISTDQREPLGRYLQRATTRWNLQMTRTRKFRRSETQEILFCQLGENLDEARWYLNLAPGRRNSTFREAGDNLHLRQDSYGICTLFRDLTDSAWVDLTGGTRDMSRTDIQDLLRVTVPTFGDALGGEVTYTEHLGITRGRPEDLRAPFGKST